MSRKALQQILGYAIGAAVFPVLVPYGLFRASRSLDHLVPAPAQPAPVVRFLVAATLLAVGVLFGAWSIVVQNVVGQGGPVQFGNVDVSPRTQRLVVTGPYRYTRNPMLFGTCMAYYAVAVFLNSAVVFLIITAFTVLMLVVVKRTEEPRLLRDFGEEYERYRRTVSMFLPRSGR